jgi:hypothetical protein
LKALEIRKKNMRKTLKKEIESTNKVSIDEAKKLLSAAITASGEDLAAKLVEARRLLENLLEFLRPSELSESIRKEIANLAAMAMPTHVIGQKTNRRKRGNVKIQQKIDFLETALKGRKEGIPLSELLDSAASKFGCKRTATFLNEALADKRFRKTKAGRSVSVVLVK